METKQGNALATASIVCAVVGFFLIAQSATLGGVIGLVSVVLGAIGIKNAKTLNSGKGAAIAGIILGCFVSVGVLKTPLDSARHRVGRDVAIKSVGRPFPAFKFTGESGALTTNQTLSGTPYVLNFNNKQDSLPTLDQFYKDHKSDGFKFYVMVPAQYGQGAINFFHSHNSDIPVLTYDHDFFFPGVREYDTPEVLLIDKNGKLSSVLFDPNYSDEVEAAVKSILKR